MPIHACFLALPFIPSYAVATAPWGKTRRLYLSGRLVGQTAVPCEDAGYIESVGPREGGVVHRNRISR